MLAIATESVVKLLAFILVGAFVTWGIFNGLEDLIGRTQTALGEHNPFSKPPDPVNFLTMTLLVRVGDSAPAAAISCDRR